MASRGINKVIIVGNLGQDPETRFSAAGAAITNVSIATGEAWKDKTTGELQERTEWHRVVFFNRLGEIAGEYLKKGSKIYIEGSLRTRKWQDKEGQDRYTTEIVASELQMLDSRGGAQDGQGGGGQYQPRQQNAPQQSSQRPQQQSQHQSQQQPQQHSQHQSQQQSQQQPQQATAMAPAGGDDWDDDIPF